MDKAQIKNTFSYHPPNPSQTKRYEELRLNARMLAEMINQSCPESREKSLAMAKLQECVMWANASIAVNE